MKLRTFLFSTLLVSSSLSYADNSNSVLCGVFAKPMAWHGSLSLQPTNQPKISVKVIELHQQQIWKTAKLIYIVNGKRTQLILNGNCYASATEAPSIRLISADKSTSAVLYITYAPTSRKLTIGTGMLPVAASDNKQQSVGGLQGTLTLHSLH